MSYRPLTDVWMLCRSKLPAGNKYYGAYPSGFLERARYLLGVTINDPVLHICSGEVMNYQSGPMRGKGVGPNDKTLDLDPELSPDFLLDARTIGVNPGDVFPYWTPGERVPGGEWEECEVGTFNVTAEGEGPMRPESGRQLWAACLIDRPYTDADAEEYAPGAENYPKELNDLLRRALSVTRIGGRVGVLDYLCPRPPRDGIGFIALVAVSTGWNNRARWYSVFERTAHNPLEWNTMRGERTEEEELAETIPEPEPIQVGDTSSVVMANPEDYAPTPTTPAPARKKKRKKKAKRSRPSAMDGFGS